MKVHPSVNVDASIRSIRASFAISMKGTSLVFQPLDSFKIDQLSGFDIKIRGLSIVGDALGWLLKGLIYPLMRNTFVKLGQDEIKKLINKHIAGKTIADLISM